MTEPQDRRHSNDVVIELIQSLRSEVNGQHERTNERLRDGIDCITKKFDVQAEKFDIHVTENHEVEKRVTRIEDRARFLWLMLVVLAGLVGWGLSFYDRSLIGCLP